MKPDITILLRDLSSPNGEVSHRAGESLIKIGRASILGLVSILETGDSSARKAAAFLLGKLPRTAESQSVLQNALSDEEPKVRKNAAISLAGLAGPEIAPALIAAFERENIGWVRVSQILAMGKIGGESVMRMLESVSPRDEEETEALRKALDRCARPRQVLQWNDTVTIPVPVIFDVPVGLETVAQAELNEKGFPNPEMIHDGKLQLSGQVSPRGLLDQLRCPYRWMLRLGSLPPFESLSRHGRLLGDMLATTTVLSELRTWLIGETGSLRYRFGLTGKKVRKVEHLEMLAIVRKSLEKHRMEDSPSSYSFEINLHCYHDQTQLWLIPAFESDKRFSYRVEDVGASINPVVAACLARLVRTAAPHTILDPTCGSGTLLFERMILGNAGTLVGMDISPTAIKAAERNADAFTGLKNVELRVADAMDARNWRPVDEILINLPFGLRTASQDRELPRLYREVSRNVVRFLNPGGNAIIYTANGKLWESNLHRRLLKTAHIRLLPTLRVCSGGISVFVFRMSRSLHS